VLSHQDSIHSFSPTLFPTKKLVDFFSSGISELTMTSEQLCGWSLQALVMNKRWKVFRGDSTSRRDLLFTVVKPSVIPLRWSTKVNVFLASNDAEQAPDFRITGSYHDGACSVSLGESNTVIGKASRHSTNQYPKPSSTLLSSQY
jgi:hypothetical protein